MSVTVYTKAHCPQCDATKRQLAKRGVAFDVVDLASDPGLVDSFLAKGFKQTPIVVTEEGSWSGYRPDMIKQVAERLAAVEA
ncbi:glutaredoxin domain-containing protein [Bifidobacterium xylocopae]|uniref:NrdH-redoxin n=1 Tax=Bifidobacterium xylocopae TaxID=2493119 RepID=A0A366KCN2_9BIFI|nr:glutaredoxin domain-containing protein [Bifidobacterium xylocopae]RBP98873.1 NrdH-redoxin [Bifidobacterium xylocopae]